MTTRRKPNSRRWHIEQADCLKVLPTLDADSVDAIVTDPPYGITINGMAWDRHEASHAFQTFNRRWASECLRVLKPGAHIAIFGGPRTFHRLVAGVEEAGFQIRDVLLWLYGGGFPKSRNLTGVHAGWGTALKPAYEPILLARKPLDGTTAENHARYGTGALHIDAARIALAHGKCSGEGRTHNQRRDPSTQGRWPANIALIHSADCTSGDCTTDCPAGLLGDRARYFYAAKASRAERDAGCEQLARKTIQTYKIGGDGKRRAESKPVANIHPTVKPIELMRWLVRLITPPDGLVLDPFAGSGSTGAAAVLEDARFIGIEREVDYVPIARARVRYWASRAGEPAVAARTPRGSDPPGTSARRPGRRR